MATYELQPSMTDDERLQRFTKATRADDLHVAAYIRQFFPEVYDQAAAYADRMRAIRAKKEEAAA
ncbi:MAG: hypothetical protein JWO67_5623 [Streptosporangiaceae bacterium]|nr:hypothetical protein [Streptosporangiaceae bacterium]